MAQPPGTHATCTKALGISGLKFSFLQNTRLPHAQPVPKQPQAAASGGPFRPAAFDFLGLNVFSAGHCGDQLPISDNFSEISEAFSVIWKFPQVKSPDGLFGAPKVDRFRT
jgi:hypothetical protein